MMYERIAGQMARALGCEVEDVLGPAEESDLDALSSLGLPDSVLDFYRQYAPLESLEVDDARIWSAPQVIEENRDFPPGADIHELGFVAVASHSDGTVYCLDLGADGRSDPPAVVAFSGAVRTGGKNRDVVESQSRHVADTFDEFLQLATRGELPA
jgi:hypothetical protein